jgi:hypothetical protein
MSKHRRKAEVLYDHKYKRIYTIGNLCAYCGEEATVLDHVPPISYAHMYKEGHKKIPSCKSCNKYLWCMDIIDIEDRKKYLLKRLTEHFRKTLNIPKWDDLELNEIKGFVNGYIKAGLAKQKILQNRLRVLACEESFILEENGKNIQMP